MTSRPHLYEGQSWQRDAACKGRNPALWDGAPTRGAARRLAQGVRICATCPVRAACLADARRVPAWDQIRGGHWFSGRDGTDQGPFDIRRHPNHAPDDAEAMPVSA